MARERGAQRLFVHHRLLLGNLRLGVLQVGGVGVERRLAHGLDLELLLVALIVDLAELRGRLERSELAHVVVGAQRDQDVAGRDIVSRHEADFLDDAGDLERQVRAVDGAQAADRLDARLPLLHRRHRGRDGLWRRRHGRHELLDHGVLEGLEAEDAAEHHADRDQHEDHTFGHRIPLRCVRAGRPSPRRPTTIVIAQPPPSRCAAARRPGSTSRRRAPGTAPRCRRNGRPAPAPARSAPAAARAAHSTASDT